MYSLLDYGKMLADRDRVWRYTTALERVVEPGSTVLDLGTGPGIFALVACRLGAAKVWAVEPAPVAELARRLAAEHGLADRIEVVEAPASQLELDEKVDVVVSDLRGVLPLAGRHLAVLRDVRRRFLRPGGRMVGERDRLFVTPIHAPELYERLTRPWDLDIFGRDLEALCGEPSPLEGLDLSIAKELALNGWLKQHQKLEGGAVLASSACWLELDYRRLEQDHGTGRAEFEVETAGVGHGLALWFEAELVTGLSLNTSPWQPPGTYGWVFLPWLRPLELAPGDQLEVDLQAVLTGADYVWTWTTRQLRGGVEAVRFEQSSFYSEPISRQRLARRDAASRPRLAPAGEVARWALERFDGSRALGELAGQLAERFPDRFADSRTALDHLATLVELYG